MGRHPSPVSAVHPCSYSPTEEASRTCARWAAAWLAPGGARCPRCGAPARPACPCIDETASFFGVHDVRSSNPAHTLHPSRTQMHAAGVSTDGAATTASRPVAQVFGMSEWLPHSLISCHQESQAHLGHSSITKYSSLPWEHRPRRPTMLSCTPEAVGNAEQSEAARHGSI